jgi:hypothetical protein
MFEIVSDAEEAQTFKEKRGYTQQSRTEKTHSLIVAVGLVACE